LSIELRREPTDAEVEAICEAAEEAARKFLAGKLDLREISDLDVLVEAIGSKPLTLNIGVALEMQIENSQLDRIVDAATEVAFAAAEARARELDLCEPVTN
jgi:hypothetical protein